MVVVVVVVVVAVGEDGDKRPLRRLGCRREEPLLKDWTADFEQVVGEKNGKKLLEGP